ncbi:hypothetical protein [uncultured Allomuricauda sp.]|uniref:hypothetical protein n=1 Tax=Flagellimonas sp. W118 TaxID=3410791 RepID=UPI00262EF145|nr:hypothetical protein [uncultured Allomuricauda sp.]
MKIRNKIFSKINVAFMAMLTIVSVTLVSCEDDDKNQLNDFLATGGFVRFVDQNPAAAIGVEQISDLSYSFSVEDANGTAVSYDLRVYADLGGVRTDTLSVEMVTSFPASFAFNADELASLVGVTVDDISFGDSFFFTAEVTNTEGNKFSGSTRLNLTEVTLEGGVYLDADGDEVAVGPEDDIRSGADGTLYVQTGGSVTDDLLDEAGYRQAFEFGFIILCPSVDLAELPGTYNVVNHAFDAFFGPQGDTRTVIAGPGANQITIIGGGLPLDGADDLVLDIDTGSSGVSYGGEAGQIHFNTFGPGTYGAVNGLVFTCIGRIDIQIDSDGFIPNFLTLQK